jgi:hypothetical protein
MAANPLLPLSFIAGPAILTNATTVLLNGASIRYNLAVGLWRDLQSERHGRDSATGFAYSDPELALSLANGRVLLIVRGLNLLYAAVAGFAFSTLAGLTGAMLINHETARVSTAAEVLTVAGCLVGLSCILAAAVFFTLESRRTRALLRLGMPARPVRSRGREVLDV